MKRIIFLLLLLPSLAFSQATGKTIANRATGGTLSIDSIQGAPSYTKFNFHQTTAGQTIIIPNLTVSRDIKVRNSGTVPITFSPGGILDTSGSLDYSWMGTKWAISASSSGGSGGLDTSAIHKTGNEIIRSGVKTFLVSPSVPTPSTGADATNKSYVDTKTAAKQDTGTALLKTGGTMSGDINMAGNKIKNPLIYDNSNVLSISPDTRLLKDASGNTIVNYQSRTNGLGVGTGAGFFGFFKTTNVSSGIATLEFPDGSGTIARTLDIPSSLPPSGSAGGGLTGTYPNPTIPAGSIDLTTKVTGLLPDANISSATTWNNKENASNKATDFTTINNILYPSVQAVNTAINNAIAGVNPAVAVNAATTTILPNTPTYSNGASGIGATLTAGSNGVLTIDGYTPIATGERLLIKNQGSSFQNGVYNISQLGTSILPYILMRATDYNQPSDINNTGSIPVVNGTINVSTSWLITSTVTTVGADALTYTQFSYAPSALLLKSQNLSDLQNKYTAQKNLGSSFNQVVDKSANFSITTANNGYEYSVTTGSSALTVTLDATTKVNGFKVFVRKADSGSGTIVFSASPTITPKLASAGHTLAIFWDSTAAVYIARPWFGGIDATGNLTFTAGVNDSIKLNTSGTGNTVLTNAILGTPTSVTLTNATGLPLSTGVTGNLPVANLNSGTSASSSTFWRGDGTWGTPASADTSLLVSKSTAQAISGLKSFTNTTKLKSFSITGTGGNGFAFFPAQSTRPPANASAGFVLSAGSTGNFGWKPTIGVDTFQRAFSGTLTANRTFTWQDSSYIVAGTNIRQTFSVPQTFSSTINKLTLTAPSTAATLTLADNSSLITSGAFGLTLKASATTNSTFPSGTDTLAGLARANVWPGLNTFTNASTQMASLKLLDATYKTALDVQSSNVLRVGNGFTSILFSQNITASGTPSIGTASAPFSSLSIQNLFFPSATNSTISFSAGSGSGALGSLNIRTANTTGTQVKTADVGMTTGDHSNAGASSFSSGSLFFDPGLIGASSTGARGHYEFNARIGAGQANTIGSGVIYIGNAYTLPSTNPTSGGVIYIDAGALKYRGSSGTVTTVGVP